MNPELGSDRLAEIASLTREYARYSRDAAGLGDVIGAVLLFLVAQTWKEQQMLLSRVFACAAPFLWVFAKEWLQRKYYQSQGRVQQQLTSGNRIAFWISTVFTVVMSTGLGIAFLVLLKANSLGDYVRLGCSIAVLVSMPLLTGRYLQGVNEHLVGTYMFMNAACAVCGVKIPLLSFFYFIAVLFAVVLLAEGFNQHRHFRDIRRRLILLGASV